MDEVQKRKAWDDYKQEKIRILESGKIKNLQIRKAIRPIIRTALFLQRKINGQTVEFINKDIPEHDKPVIYAVTHIGKWDFEIVNEQIKDHFHIIASDFMNMYGNFNGFFMNAMGVIFVDEKDKLDRKNSYNMMRLVLREGDNQMILPEGTWNISENEIIKDLNFGTVKLALEENTAIIPIAVEQYDKRFVINIGELFNASEKVKEYGYGEYNSIKDENLKKAILVSLNNDLRDTMATLKYNIWEKQGITKRKDIPYNYQDLFVADRLAEWPGYSMEEQITNVYIPEYKKDYTNMLEEITKMKIHENNEFMFMNKDEFIKKYVKK